MSEVPSIMMLTLAAGVAIPVGGCIAAIERLLPDWLEREWRHFVIALGGGILLGAVSVVLVPEGVASMERSPLAIPVVLAGSVTFFLIERTLGLRRRESPQLMGMLLDFVPEAVALGGMVAIGAAAAPLLALLIGLQNLPEGFNAYRELVQRGGHGRRATLLAMTALVVIGPIAGLIGYFLLSAHRAVLGALMLFAAGGILYLIFQEIAPQSRLKRHWAPPLGAAVGFCIALLGDMLVVGR